MKVRKLPSTLEMRKLIARIELFLLWVSYKVAYVAVTTTLNSLPR